MQNNEPISLYCADETDGESLRPCQQVLETLLQYELDSGDTEPALATACEGNEDATVWTCTLREGVKFHDGSMLRRQRRGRLLGHRHRCRQPESHRQHRRFRLLLLSVGWLDEPGRGRIGTVRNGE